MPAPPRIDTYSKRMDGYSGRIAAYFVADGPSNNESD